MRMAIGVMTVWMILAAAAAPGLAQDARPLSDASSARPATLHELVLRDGSRLYGTIQREAADEIVFRTQSGTTVTVARSDVASVRSVTGTIVAGEFRRGDPNTSRLFFAPTARSLRKGQVYLGVFEFVMPFVQVGVTDRLSIGGGTPLVFGFEDEWERPFWVTPKLQVYDGESRQFAVGVFHAFDTDGNGGGIGYGVGTFGRQDASVTIGGGVAYSGDEGTGLLMVGGERQFTRSLKFISENYIWSGGNGIASAGIRFFGERLSADLALAVPIGADGFFAFPVINFVYLF